MVPYSGGFELRFCCVKELLVSLSVVPAFKIVFYQVNNSQQPQVSA